MKKTFLLIAALLMMGSAAFAGGDGLDFGLKAGYQTAKLSYDKANIKSDFTNHFTLGLYGRVTFGRIYVQPELLYFKTSNVFNASVTGMESENLFNLPTGANVNLTLNQMNLQVPIMFGFKTIDFDAITLRLQVGPTANFVLKSQTLYDETYTLNDEQFEMEEPVTSTEENFDPKSIAWGVQGGVGVDVLDRFSLDINYGFGLSKMFSALNNTSLGETFDFSNIDDTKQSMFMVTVGVKLF
jgi:opacity protein-like surface antigen